MERVKPAIIRSRYAVVYGCAHDGEIISKKHPCMHVGTVHFLSATTTTRRFTWSVKYLFVCYLLSEKVARFFSQLLITLYLEVWRILAQSSHHTKISTNTCEIKLDIRVGLGSRDIVILSYTFNFKMIFKWCKQKKHRYLCKMWRRQYNVYIDDN